MTPQSNLALESAQMYLASRVRVRTPLGAGEYLECLRHHARETYDKRLSIALDCLSIYRQLFTEQYARSAAPPFSMQREHEFYRLVHTQCFPLHVDDETDLLTYLAREPRFFLPFIPLRGLQRHDWAAGTFEYEKLDLPYQLALIMMEGNNEPVTLLTKPPITLPPTAPPLAAVGWSLFTNACKVAGGPLRFLPLAFNLINYKTGNMWLDLPRRAGYVVRAWSLETVSALTLMRVEAEKYDIAMRALHNWFHEDLAGCLGTAVKLWNDASQKERESGYEGMMTDELVDAGWLPLGNDLVAAPPGEMERVMGALHEQLYEQERGQLN